MSETFGDNAERARYELDVGGAIVFANYRRMGDSIAITHVEAPVHLRGTGAASRLMDHVVEAVRADGRAIVPLCGYAASWLRQHSQQTA